MFASIYVVVVADVPWWTEAIVVGSPLVVFFVALPFLARSRIRRLLAETKSNDLEEVVWGVARAFSWISGFQLFYLLAPQLANRGYRGRTIRISTGLLPTLAPPFDVPFEPHPLGQAESLLGQLELSSARTRGGSEKRLLEGKRVKPSRPNLRVVGDAISLVAGLAFVPLFALAAARGSIPAPGALLVCASMLLYYVAIRTRPVEWLIVPGGLIRRTAHLLASRWRPCLFDRRTSVFLAYAVSPAADRARFWTVTVSNGTASGTFRLEREQLEMVLRAWLSPLRPPAPDRLTDLG